jgi:hypothetical protein
MSFLRFRRRPEPTIHEAEAYARCYGDRRGEILGVSRVEPRRPRYRLDVSGESLRRAFERRIDSRVAPKS